MQFIFKYFYFLYYKNFFKDLRNNLKKYISFMKTFKYSNIKNNDVSISEKDFKVIKKTLKRFIKCDIRGIEIADYFLDADLAYSQKQLDISKIASNDPILLCVEKDDYGKIKKLYEHYTSIGVKNFVFIDNNSTDDTIKYLSTKKNVDIITCNSKYYTTAREAWLNRVLCHYGYNRWYLIVDSDEMYNYIGSEKEDIHEHIKKLLSNGSTRELSLMVDMYSKNGAFCDSNNFIEEYKYFDTDSYQIKFNKYYTMLTGGPRKRIFKENGSEKDFMLGKYPLFYFEKGDLQSNSHFTFPYYKNLYKDCTSVLMHYKFIGKSDVEKYKKIIKDKNYYNGSQEYKLYMEKYNGKENINFYNEDSIEYKNSLSLKEINILKED